MEERIISFRTFKQSYCPDSKSPLTETKCPEKYHDECNEKSCLRWKRLKPSKRKNLEQVEKRVKELEGGIQDATDNLNVSELGYTEALCRLVKKLKRLLTSIPIPDNKCSEQRKCHICDEKMKRSYGGWDCGICKRFFTDKYLELYVNNTGSPDRKGG